MVIGDKLILVIKNYSAEHCVLIGWKHNGAGVVGESHLICGIRFRLIYN